MGFPGHSYVGSSLGLPDLEYYDENPDEKSLFKITDISVTVAGVKNKIL